MWTLFTVSSFKKLLEAPAIFHGRPYSKLIEIKSNLRRKKPHRVDQGSSYLGGSFNNRDQEPQSNLEETRDFFVFKNKHTHFTTNGNRVITMVKEHKLNYSSIEIKEAISCPSPQCLRSRSAANSSCSHKSDV